MNPPMGPIGFWVAAMTYVELMQADVTYYKRQPETEAAQTPPIAHSPHEVWLAMDVKPHRQVPAPDRIEWGKRVGLLVIVEADHDHLQPLEWIPG